MARIEDILNRYRATLTETLETVSGLRVSTNPSRENHFLAEVMGSRRDWLTAQGAFEVRCLLDMDGNLYFWDAGRGVHTNVADNLGLEPDSCAKGNFTLIFNDDLKIFMSHNNRVFADSRRIPHDLSLRIVEKAEDKIRSIFKGYEFTSGGSYS